MTNLFDWRPSSTAPPGVPVVVMTLTTFTASWRCPVDIYPDLGLMSLVDGHWRRVDGTGAPAVEGWWTTREQYADAIPDRHWRTAPIRVRGFIICPLVFVRPPPHYEARVVWPAGIEHPSYSWHSVPSYSPASPMSPSYLDEGSCALAMRWCMMSEFLPPEAFERRQENLRRDYESQQRLWRGLSVAGPPGAPGVTSSDYVGDLTRRR